jgi:hypothetical protein
MPHSGIHKWAWYLLIMQMRVGDALHGQDAQAASDPTANNEKRLTKGFPAKVLPFMVRYLTTNGESAVYIPRPPFALSGIEGRKVSFAGSSNYK